LNKESPNSSRNPSISNAGFVSERKSEYAEDGNEEETQVNKKRNGWLFFFLAFYNSPFIILKLFYAGSKFKQQGLPAWNPIYTAQAVLPIFAVMSFVFIPVGITLLHFTNLVNEITIPYTRCVSKTNPSITCDKILKADRTNGICSCEVEFHLPNDFEVFQN
jgi:hypothetical protein